MNSRTKKKKQILRRDLLVHVQDEPKNLFDEMEYRRSLQRPPLDLNIHILLRLRHDQPPFPFQTFPPEIQKC